MITNEFSTLSDLKWHERRIGDIIPYPIDKRFNVEPERWESIYPTRSFVKTIDTCKEIVPVFGDSFMFCSGVPKQHEITHKLRNIYPKITFLNLSKPGSSNGRIVTRLEQWTNDELSNKTKTIIIGLSSMYRHEYYMDSEHPNNVSPHNSIYAPMNSHYLRGYDIMPQVTPNELITPEDSKTRNRIAKPLSNTWLAMIEHQTSYTNSFIKNLEINLRRIDWITKAMKWNIIFVENQSWLDYQHSEDKKCINKYLQDMDISTRKCKVIQMTETIGTITDKLDCGHWGTDTINNMIKQIKRIFDEI